VEEFFQVRGIGTIVSGFVTRGTWEIDEPLLMDQLKDGKVVQVVPKSAHVVQMSVDRVWASHQFCFALPKLSRSRLRLLDKGMIGMEQTFTLSRKFLADIFLTRRSTVTMQSGKFQATARILHMKQSVKVVEIRVNEKKEDVTRQGDTALVTFEFSI
jgi:GTPase